MSEFDRGPRQSLKKNVHFSDRSEVRNKYDPIIEFSNLQNKHVQAFEAFLTTSFKPDAPRGKKAKSFADGFPNADLDKLEDARLDRPRVFDLARDRSINIETVCAAALAWGGMRIDHRDLLAEKHDWICVAQEIRDGNLDRRLAYEAFRELSDRDLLKGMGPAFYTKLIYFLTPRNGGEFPTAYIMDQWAGCSINLLSDRPVVLTDATVHWVRVGGELRTNSNFRVSRFNTGAHYDDFCNRMDALACEFKLSADETDRAVMGDDSKARTGWRDYVTKHRKLQT